MTLFCIKKGAREATINLFVVKREPVGSNRDFSLYKERAWWKQAWFYYL